MPDDKFAKAFWSRVRSGGESCWEWTGTRESYGYGRLGWKRRRYLAHRMAWLLHNKTESIPAGMSVMHTCDNPLCCRPDHLSLGTHLQNMQDAAIKNRWAATRKLSFDDVREIRDLARRGVRFADIARKFKVNPSSVSRVVHGQRRSSVSQEAA